MIALILVVSVDHEIYKPVDHFAKEEASGDCS
jgi:hypothetical protein